MQIPKRKSEELRESKLEPEDNYMTPEKIERLTRQVHDLEHVQHPKAAAEVQRTAAMGDFSENAAYQDAKHRLRRINGRILSLKERLRNAIPISKTNYTGKVQIGSIVTIFGNNKQYTYQILGSAETDPPKGLISHLSPIGAALLGHEAGDRVTININGQEAVYDIIEVS